MTQPLRIRARGLVLARWLPGRQPVSRWCCQMDSYIATRGGLT